MSKPDDIEQWAWDKAYESVYRGDWTVVEQVARALMAERDACAKVASDYSDHPNELAAFIGEEIAQAILSRK